MKRTAFLLPLLSFCLVAVASPVLGQTYLNQVGTPSFGVNIPIENGSIDLSNGNLHMEFPLATHPQRGALNLNERLVYDSRIWTIVAYSNHYWWPLNIPNVPQAQAGWRFVTGAETGTLSTGTLSTSSAQCTNIQMPGYYGTDSKVASSVTWTDPSGTSHTFDGSYTEEDNGCSNSSPYTHSVVSGYATDGSGYQLRGDTNGNPLIVDNGGTQVYPQVIDRYGNFWSFDGNGNLIDDTGRVPVIVTTNANGNANVTWYDVLAPNGPIQNNGTRVRYIVTTAPILVGTGFQQSGVTEWPNQGGAGTLSPVSSIQLPDGSSYTFNYDHKISLSDQVPHYGDLMSVTLPTGGVIHYTYASFFDSYQNVNHWLASRTVGSNPAMTFTPSVLTFCAANGTGCQEQVAVHKPSGDETVYQLTLNNGAWNTNTTAYTGAVSANHGIVQTTNTYDFSHPCNTQICTGAEYIQKSISTTKLLDTGVQSQSQAIYNNPGLGKITALKEWDYQTSGLWATPTRETDYTYTGFDVQSVTVLGNGAEAGQTTYGYTTTATQTSGVAQHGTQNAGGPYLKSVSHALFSGNPPSTPPTVTTTYGMDDTGQVVSTSDPNGNPASTVSYQCANSLPYQAKNPLGQTTQYTYDCNSGAVAGVQDPNDLANNRAGTTYAYESGAGRPHSVTYPDGGQTTYTYPSATEVDTAVLATPSPSISSQDFLDSFGRKYQHVQAGVSSETTYDANGRVSCVTNPHTGSGAGTDGSTCVTAYDGLDRPLTQQQPDNTTLGWTYNGATVNSTDETLKQWKRTSDSFGHLVTVVEPGNYATTYTYDGLGNLQKINQTGVAGTDTPRVRTFVHDSLSRLTNECHPEAVAGGQLCSANGPWSTSYSYYPAGNLKTQTDARGVTATLGYDVLNRLIRKSYGDGTPGQTFGYDETSNWMGPQYNTAGRLSSLGTDQDKRYFGSGSAPGCNPLSSSTANYNPANGNPTYCQMTAELYSYDAMGRVNHIGTAPPSEAGWNNHQTYATYDAAGQMTRLQYPDGRVVTQSFDGAAHLQNVVFDSWNGQHVGYTYASGFTYTPAGAQAELTLGNGVYTHTPYNNRQQICQTWIQNSRQPLLDKHYMYGDSSQWCANTPTNNGTISQILDERNGNRSQGFSYDGLNRLYSFSSGDQTMQQTYSLDPFGNFSQSGTLNFQAGMQGKNQLMVNGMGYDNAGNTTAANFGAGQTSYQFDGGGRMFSVNNAAAYYTYDAAGDRMRKDTANGWTEYQYLNGQVVAEKAQDGTWSDYIYANGQKIARADSYDARIHLSGTQCSNCGWSTAAWDLPLTGYVVKNGDAVSWRQFQAGTAIGGYTIQFTDGTLTAWNTKDTNGQVMNILSTQGQWVNRTVDLSAYAGKTIQVSWVVADGDTTPGNWSEYYSDMAITGTDGTVTPVYTRQSNIGLSYFGSAGMTNLWGRVEFSNGPGDSVQGYTTTTYYHGDHLGSARMTTSGGGWPTTSDTFYPYGQEPGGAVGPNHYQYARLERDPETGLDHATFRQYSSTTGRWMSPDPYDGSMDLGNPQSLNRYSYVTNNPLGLTDPSGLDGGGSGTNILIGIATIGVGALIDEIFGGSPSFHGSTTRRADGDPNNRQIWDEYHIHYGADIAGALGLPSQGCEFGACGNSLTDYNQQQTSSQLQTAYNEVTAGRIIGLLNIKNHSCGECKYDYGWNSHSADTWNVCGQILNADQMGNFMAGYQSGVYDSYYFWTTGAIWAQGSVDAAGVLYHLTGRTKATSDPLDRTGMPDILRGQRYARHGCSGM